MEAELQAAGQNIRTVFLDEVQRVPALLDVVQVILDSEPGRFRFLLSGSSARKLRRGEVNLLPGRIHVHHLHPLVASELGEDFDLDRCLAHGTLPGIYAEPDPEVRAQTLRSFVDIYLREEIKAEAIVRDVGGFARLLDLVAASSGRVINLNAMSRDAAVSYETARRYLGVLEDTLVVFSVPAWRPSDRAGLIAHPRSSLSMSAFETLSCADHWIRHSKTSAGICSSISLPMNFTDASEGSGQRPRCFISVLKGAQRLIWFSRLDASCGESK